MRRTHFSWLMALIGTSLIALAGILVNSLPFNQIKNTLNRAAPDGNLESFTVERLASARLVINPIGVIAFAILLILIIRKDRAQLWIATALDKFRQFLQAFRGDAASFWQSLIAFFPRSKETGLLVLIIIAGAILRLILLDRPMQHDESYTYIAFASRGLLKIISDYHLPNNHVLHSMLVYFSERLFGNAPWAIRMPAFLAGVATIPVAYVAGRKTFNSLAGLSAAALMAFNLYSIHNSTQARGYSMLALFTLLLWIFAVKLVHERNLFVWLLFATCSALGFFTSPTMLYPIAAITLWLGVNRVLRTQASKYANKHFWIDFASSLLLSGLLTLLFYSLILANYGLSYLINNPIISRMRDPNYTAFFENLASRWGKAWWAWHEGAFPGLAIAGLIMFGLAIFYYRRYASSKIALPVIGIAVVLSIAVIQRTVGWVRIWGFALPIYMVFVGGGISTITDITKRRLGDAWKWILPTTIIAAFAISTISVINEGSNAWQERLGAPGEVERASEFLGQRIDEDSLIFVSAPDAPAFWYYSRAMNFPADIFESSRTDANHMYIVQNTGSNKAIEKIIGANDLAQSLYEDEDYELIYSSRKINIYNLQKR